MLLVSAVAARGGSINGYAYDKFTDQPLNNAKVVVTGTKLQTTTDSTGNFRFPEIDGGIYDLEISLDNYHEGFLKRIRVGTRQDLSVEVRLKPITVEDRAKGPKALFRYGKVTGTITNKTTGAELPGASIKIVELATGTVSRVDGGYSLLQIKPGRYTLEISLIGYIQVKNYGVEVYAGDELKMDFKLEETVLPLGSKVIVYGERPLMDPMTPAAVRSIEPQDIKLGGTRDLGEILKELPGVVEIDKELHIRGGRTYETQYMVDGVPITDPLIRRGYGLSLKRQFDSGTESVHRRRGC